MIEICFLKQRFTDSIIYRNVDTPDSVIAKSIDREDIQNTQLMVSKLITVCKAISQDEADAKLHKMESSPFEPVDTKKIMPGISLIENILKIEHLMTLDHFFQIFNLTLSFEHYDELVWPIPNDFMPDHVYDNGRYDVNLTFNIQPMATDQSASVVRSCMSKFKSKK